MKEGSQVRGVVLPVDNGAALEIWENRAVFRYSQGDARLITYPSPCLQKGLARPNCKLRAQP
jgi:hypothetical protein